MFGQGATTAVDPDVPARYAPPPLQVGTVSPSRTAQREQQAKRRGATVPVLDGPSRAAAGFPQPPADLEAVDTPLDGAERPGAGPLPLAHPCEPCATPPSPAHGEVPSERRLRAPRPRGAVAPPPQPRGHPHGVLPPMDGHGRAPRWGPSALQRVPQGLAVWGPALHKALGWRYGAAAPLWQSPRLHWGEGAQPSLVAPLLTPLWDLGPLPVRHAAAAAPQAWASAPQCRVLLVEGWDNDAEGSGGHWVGVTHGGTVRCLLRGDRSLAAPQDALAAAGAVLASIPRVYAVWYAVTPAPGSPHAPRCTGTPAQGTTPTLGCGSWSAHSCRRGGSAAGCTPCSTRPDLGVQAPGGRPLRPPWPSLLPRLTPPAPCAVVHGGREPGPSTQSRGPRLVTGRGLAAVAATPTVTSTLC